MKGPDFPTGGQILNTADELKEIYRTGSGAVRLRAHVGGGDVGRSVKTLVVTSIPYTVDKSELVGAHRRDRREPQAAAASSTCATSRPTTCGSSSS